MSFKDELTAEVNSVRQKIKTEAINHFINTLKKAMKYTAAKGMTNGSISLRLNFDKFEDGYEDGYEEDLAEDNTGDLELYRLSELLLMTQERKPGAIEIYNWLIKEIDKTGVFKGININIDEEKYELEFFWYIED